MFLGLCTYVCCGSCEMLLYNYSGEIWTQVFPTTFYKYVSEISSFIVESRFVMESVRQSLVLV